MGLRGMRVRKIPLVRVLYAEATRPFPVNAKGAGPQTSKKQERDTPTHLIKITPPHMMDVFLKIDL